MNRAVLRIVREQLQRFLAVFFSAVIEGATHHNFLALRVDTSSKKNSGSLRGSWTVQPVSVSAICDHVLLRVAGIDADGVQLHHFAAVILVQPAVFFFLLAVAPLPPGTGDLAAGNVPGGGGCAPVKIP